MLKNRFLFLTNLACHRRVQTGLSQVTDSPCLSITLPGLSDSVQVYAGCPLTPHSTVTGIRGVTLPHTPWLRSAPLRVRPASRIEAKMGEPYTIVIESIKELLMDAKGGLSIENEITLLPLCVSFSHLFNIEMKRRALKDILQRFRKVSYLQSTSHRIV